MTTPSMDVDYDGDLPDDCGDLGIRIDRQGRWFYHGSPINRKEMVCLFASVMHRAKDGTYLLITPGEMGRIEVEDVPFLAVEMYVGGCGRERVISFRTNMDEMVTVDAAHPLRIVEDAHGVEGETSPYVLVRNGLEARLTRSVYYGLIDQCYSEIFDGGGEEGKPLNRFGLWSSGVFFELGKLDD